MAEEHVKETDAVPVNDEGTGSMTEEADATVKPEDSAELPGQDSAAEDGNSSGPSSECEPPIMLEGDEGTSTW